jgi:hypothetical protein
VVQLIADDGVVFTQQRLEEPAIGVKGGGVEDGVLGAQKTCQARFQRLVQILRAADEAHRGQAVAMRSQRLVCGLNHGRMRGQPEVVVGTEVDDLAAIAGLHQGALGRGDDALALVKPGIPNALQFLAQMSIEIFAAGHGWPPGAKYSK